MLNPALRKIAVIGISGTGKSTVSREIAATTKLPLYHMDCIIWGENWKEADTPAIERALSKIVPTDSWIIEGWIDEYSKDLLEKADLVLYLDYPGWMAMCGGFQRWWRYRGKTRPEMPNGCVESFGLKYLQVMLERRERPHIEKQLADFKPKNVVRCLSRNQAKQKLRELFGDVRCG